MKNKNGEIREQSISAIFKCPSETTARVFFAKIFERFACLLGPFLGSFGIIQGESLGTMIGDSIEGFIVWCRGV